MKNVILIFFISITLSCSFDNKTGIWKDISNIKVDNSSVESIEANTSVTRYEDVFIKNKIFNEEVNVSNNFFSKLEVPIRVENWSEEYGAKTNNISNFYYNGSKNILSKSSKLSRLSLKKNLIFYKNNLINFDHKGAIFIYSTSQKKKIFKFNFYKKKFKNVKKQIYLLVNDNVLYAADNLGYIYAIDVKNKSLIWAKNYGIPFRSNLKFADGQIFLANQDNVIYSINAKTGNKNWQYSTNLTFLKSDFKNNFAIDEFNKNLFFLNTNGEFYSINYLNRKINWVLNLKNSALPGDTSLFLSQPIVIKKKNLIISIKNTILNYNTLNGSINWSLLSNTRLKPILTTNYAYILSNKDLLICVDNKTGQVLWSQNIYNNVEEKIRIKKIGKFFDLKMINNEINIFSKNGYLLSFNHKNGKILNIKKISKKGINSEIVVLKDNIFLVDNNNRLLKF
jgi:outer membrane protein assembly factor BamB